MLVRTDDEVYRIDAVWLGPPRATFPWRARYVSYGVGLLVMMMIMFVQRRLGVALDFFSVAWSLVGTVAITRLLGKKITYERPFGQVVTQFWAEVTGPRIRTATGGGAIRAAHVRVRPTRGPAPATSRRRRPPAGRATVRPSNAPGTTGRAAPQRVRPDAAAWARRSSAERAGRGAVTPARGSSATTARAPRDKAPQNTQRSRRTPGEPRADRKKGILRGRA